VTWADAYSNAARLRAWRALGVAIWPGQRAAQLIRTGLFAKQAVRAQREGECLRSASAGEGRALDGLPKAGMFGPTPRCMIRRDLRPLKMQPSTTGLAEAAMCPKPSSRRGVSRAACSGDREAVCAYQIDPTGHQRHLGAITELLNALADKRAQLTCSDGAVLVSVGGTAQTV
jgi:hypothetical protein